MPKITPIIVMYESHYDTASYQMRLKEWPQLLLCGYQCFVDEQFSDWTLESKMSKLQANFDLLCPDSLMGNIKGFFYSRPSDSTLAPDIEAKLAPEKLELQLLKFLKENNCKYIAADIPVSEVVSYSRSEKFTSSKYFSSNYTQAERCQIVSSGMFPEYQDLFDRRNKSLCDSIKNAASTHGVIAAAGFLHASGMQKYFRDNYPDLDILSVYPYSQSHSDIEVDVQNVQKEEKFFPTGIFRNDASKNNSNQKYLGNLVSSFEAMMEGINKGDELRENNQFSEALNEYLKVKKICNLLVGYNHRKVMLCLIRVKICFCLLGKGDTKLAKAIQRNLKEESLDLPESKYKKELVKMIDEFSSVVDQAQKLQDQATQSIGLG
jgi:hypothetical protein